MAVATLFATSQGLAVVDGGHRRWVDTHWFRGNSYFRIGCDWIKVAVLNAWNLMSVSLLILTPNPLWLHAHNIVSDCIVSNSLSTLISTFLHNFCQSIRVKGKAAIPFYRIGKGRSLFRD
jgi:hypothetical protein